MYITVQTLAAQARIFVQPRYFYSAAYVSSRQQVILLVFVTQPDTKRADHS